MESSYIAILVMSLFNCVILNITNIHATNMEKITAEDLLDVLHRRAHEVGRISQFSNEEKAVVTGYRNINDSDQKMTEDTIVGIGSISKDFTSALILKLWDKEITANLQEKSFPQGMDTKLSHFMGRLEKRFPGCVDLFNRIRRDDHYQEIKLRDILNHTHGLGARDDTEATKLVQDSAEPLTLAEIANITKKRPGEVYGKFMYGNFSYDLAAMIAEAITEKPFAKLLKDEVIKPCGLGHTYTQDEHLALYANPNSDIATGYASAARAVQADPKLKGRLNTQPLNFNTKSNTVAAGGMKSNNADLRKWAGHFMGGKMFTNQVVIDTLQAYSQGADRKHGNKYHLGQMCENPIKDQPGRFEKVGHDGHDTLFMAHLRYFPATGQIVSQLAVSEDLSNYLAFEIFKELYPDKLDNSQEEKPTEKVKGMKELVNQYWQEMPKAGSPCPMSEEWKKKTGEIAAAKFKEFPDLELFFGIYKQVKQTIDQEITQRTSITEIDQNKEAFIEKFVGTKLLQPRGKKTGEKSYIQGVNILPETVPREVHERSNAS
jgi:CubicO group peptidase (beta-lactamase class C family)